MTTPAKTRPDPAVRHSFVPVSTSIAAWTVDPITNRSHRFTPDDAELYAFLERVKANGKHHRWLAQAHVDLVALDQRQPGAGWHDIAMACTAEPDDSAKAAP